MTKLQFHAVPSVQQIELQFEVLFTNKIIRKYVGIFDLRCHTYCLYR